MCVIQLYNASELSSYCEGYFLQHLSQLLTTSDSFTRMVYSSRRQSYQLMTGVLTTLTDKLTARLASKRRLAPGIRLWNRIVMRKSRAPCRLNIDTDTSKAKNGIFSSYRPIITFINKILPSTETDWKQIFQCETVMCTHTFTVLVIAKSNDNLWK